MIISEDIINRLSFFDKLRLRITRRLLPRLLRHQPDEASTLAQLADVELLLGNPLIANQRYKELLKHNPYRVEALFCRGFALEYLGEFEEALRCYTIVDALAPAFTEAARRRDQLVRQLDAANTILESQRRSSSRPAPDTPEGMVDQGSVLFASGYFEEALTLFERAIDLKPDFALAHNNRGSSLYKLDRFDDAVASYDRAISIDKKNVEAIRNKGVLLSKLGDIEASNACFERALALQPYDTTALFNRSVNLMARLDIDGALQTLDEVLAFRPDNADANWNKAFCKLLLGELQEGFRLYEWRLRRSAIAIPDKCVDPVSLLARPLENKTVLVETEQGFGDFIQFCRYIPYLKQRCAQVIVRVPDALANLAKSLDPTIKVVVRGKPIPRHDVACLIASLPLAFKTTLDTIPADVPYLRADSSKRQHWKNRLGERKGLRVGLVWSGGFRPDQPEVWSTNERRNVPLQKLAPLNVPGAEFFSLQIGNDSVQQLRDLIDNGWTGPQIMDLTDDIEDFSDTAAFIDHLDLVISVDTSTAHLAGALGKPVWILNRFDTCWRWMLNRSDSPWYPLARLFRQPEPGNWDAVVADVRAALQQLIAGQEHPA